MKKLFLFLTAGLFALSAGAQQSQSIVLNPVTNVKHNAAPARIGNADAQKSARKHSATQHANARTTDNTNSDWFSYITQLQGSNSVYSYWNMYQDSNVYQTFADQSTPAVFIMGLGASFDPASLAFTSQAADPTLSKSFAVTDTDAYTIDSLAFTGKYFQVDPTKTDTLFVDLAIATHDTTSGTYLLGFLPTGDIHTELGISDSQYHFATADYDTGFNGMSADSVISRVELIIPLTTEVANDTDVTTGANLFVYHIPTSANSLNGMLNAPAGAKIVSNIHFKADASTQAPLPTDIQTVNHWEQGSLAINGGNGQYEYQLQGDYSTGLVVNSSDRYDAAGTYNPPPTDPSDPTSGPFYATFDGHHFIYPSYLAFTVNAGFSAPYNPDIEFHLNCATCGAPTTPPNNGVATVNNAISKINAYPSPATSELNVSYTLSTSAPVTVTLTNTLGQVVGSQNMGTVNSGVATFTTSNLAGGIYFYTVNAGSQRTTGRILIAH